jgi:hypothetical protein
MSTLLRHDGLVFEDDAVHARGHAYFRCTFRRCTIIVRDGDTYWSECRFDSCVWHFDYVFDDIGQVQQIREMLPLIEVSLVRSPDERNDS